MERTLRELLVPILAILIILPLVAEITVGSATGQPPLPTMRVRDQQFKPVVIPTTNSQPTMPHEVPIPSTENYPVFRIQPTTGVKVEQKPGWISEPEVSWYGPGFYGRRTACGQSYTKQILGVAHRSLPCGTLVEFRWAGRTAVVPVIDRGPYIRGRDWDLSGGLCTLLEHCFTGPIEWRIVP